MHHLDALAIAKQRQHDFERDADDHRAARAEARRAEPAKSSSRLGAAARRRPAII